MTSSGHDSNQFIECFNSRAIQLSWKRVISSVKSDAKDFFGISVFKANLDKNISELSSIILSNSYQPKRPFKYYEPKSSGTQRTKTVLNIEDALVYQAIGNFIGFKLFDQLTDCKQSVFGSVLHNDVKSGVDILDNQESDFFFFEYYVELYNRFIESINETLENPKISHILETDITGFFDSIPHSTLILELKQKGIDDSILNLLANCLNAWSGTRDAYTIGVGIPQGPSTSYLLANVFLDSIDREIIGKGIFYYRFMDDIRIYSVGQENLNAILVLLDKRLKSKALSLNSHKTSLQSLSDFKDERDKILDSSMFEIEFNKSDFDIENTEQGGSNIEDDLKDKVEYSKIALKLYTLKIKEIEDKIQEFILGIKNSKEPVSKSDFRTFLTLSYNWRKISSVLYGDYEYKPNVLMIPYWLDGLRLFYWKSNHIVWNLKFYDNLPDYSGQFIDLLDYFKEYEWVQYQILQLIGIVLKKDTGLKHDLLEALTKTENPLTRLGYFSILIQTIKSDTKFFEMVSMQLKKEKNNYVKNYVLYLIRQKHIKVELDTLKNWFE